MADILSNLLEDNKITPLTIAKEFKNSGAENTTEGGTWSKESMCEIPTIKNNNISCVVSDVNNKDKIIQTLRDGGYVISLQNPGYWTDALHYVVIHGYDGTYFFADDPMMRRYRQKADDFMKTHSVGVYVKKK